MTLRSESTRKRDSSNVGGRVALRRGLLIGVGAAAVVGVVSGLARLGLVTGWGASRASEHGPLLAIGAFGTVIALERAVALRQRWAFAAPALGALCSVAFLTSARASWLPALSAALLVAVNVAVIRRQSAVYTWMMLAGSGSLLVGNTLLAVGYSVSQITPTWLAFFVLTIVAERLELSRLAPTPRGASAVLVSLSVLFFAGCLARTLGYDGSRAMGAGMVGLATWQCRLDIARRTIRHDGLPRYVAIGVFGGAIWLGATGILWVVEAIPRAGPLYDAALHGVFVGYVLSMVFAHAMIILPAVARVGLTFHRAYYAPLALLHVGLFARVVGDLAGLARLRQMGGLSTAAALALFAVVAFSSQIFERFSRAR